MKYKDVNKNIALLSFTLYLFFAFFGTGLPFQQKVESVDKIGTSNIANQIIYTSLFLLSSFSLVYKRRDLLRLILEEKFLTLFLFWCLATIFWSDYSFISFKRYFQFLTTVIVSVAILLYVEKSSDLLKYIKYLLAIFILLSLISVLVIPGAKHVEGAWRGLADTKNNLGQMAVLSIVVWTIDFMLNKNWRKKLTAFIIVMMSFTLLIGARSGTSMISVIVIVFLAILLRIDKEFSPIGIRNTTSFLILITISLIVILLVVYKSSIFEDMALLLGKDSTMTGRIYLWADMFLVIDKHLLLGCGYQGFWDVTSPYVLMFYEQYGWLPNQAHNGYIDIINELGVIGFILFVFVVLNYFYKISGSKLASYWKWIIIATLIINIQETTIIRPHHQTGVLFLFSYLTLFSDLIKNRRIK